MDTELRGLVVAACRILFHEGHEHLYLGHVSARAEPGADRFWVKPTGMGLGDVTADDLVLVDLDGRRLAGDRPLHHELPIHSEIYRRRADVMAVIHTHPLHASALAASRGRVLMVSQDSVPFAAGVGWYDSAELVVTAEQGQRVADSLGDRPLVLLRNHGIAVADASVEGAVCLAVGIERSVKVQLAAATLGEVVEIAPDELEAMTRYFASSYANRTRLTFDYLRHRAGT